ncbi:MAG: DUF72 domain-containing protein [Saprospiraceae bacterium]
MRTLWIGCSGFYNRHWIEIFYPVHIKQKDWFSFYCRHLNTIELNTTFYKFPTVKSLDKWYHESPEVFSFSVKAPRMITHFKKMNDCETLLDDFYGACHEGLGDKLGCLLFQFPPMFQYTPERLHLITSQLRPGFRNVVEFRHTSWWDEKILEVLELHNIIFCRPDHPLMPDLYLDFSQFTYVRLHGNPVLFHSNYGEEFLNFIKNGIQAISELEEAYIYFNNTAGTSGILNALQLKALMDDNDAGG